MFQTLKPSDIEKFMTLSESNNNIVPAAKELCLKVVPSLDTTTAHTLALYQHPSIIVDMPEALRSHIANPKNFFKIFGVCKDITLQPICVIITPDVMQLITERVDLEEFVEFLQNTQAPSLQSTEALTVIGEADSSDDDALPQWYD